MGTLLCLLLSVSTPAGTQEVRVGMEVRHAPWAYLPGEEDALHDLTSAPQIPAGHAQRVRGFDVDVLRALSRRLGLPARIVPTAKSDLEAGLLAGRFDVILSAWTPRPDTPEAIASTAPYAEWGLLLVVRRDDPRVQSVADLDGLIVGHYRDPAVEKPLRAMGHGQFQVADSSAALFRQLKARTIDAVLFDSVHARWRASRDPSLRVTGEPLNRLGYHVGVLRSNPGLFSRLQAAVVDLVASPEMAAIRKQWEGSGPVAAAVTGGQPPRKAPRQ
jgi:L-cystine transport system substrate-binding protein